mgnify:CR=1 FL=1
MVDVAERGLDQEPPVAGAGEGEELLELVGREKLQVLEISRSGFSLKIDGHGAEPSVSYVQPPVAQPLVLAPPTARPTTPAAAPAAGAAEEAEEGGLPEGAHVLHSPIVGTFYAAPNPESDPYVRPGDRVKTGQVLCIVEAMKLMNEIEADVDGTILQILPKNAQPVEFGEPLFAIEPD